MRYIISSGFVRDKDVMVFNPNNWDDYCYKTTFEARYIDTDGNDIEIESKK